MAFVPARINSSPLGNLIIACSVFFVTLALFPPELTAQMKLAWDPNTEPDVAGYRVHYGTSSRTYGTPINVGNVTTYTLNGLSPGVTYYIAVTAYDTASNESAYSNEVAGKITETVSSPTVLGGPMSGTGGTSNTYTAGGSSSNLGHSVEYQFDWKGDATDLSTWGSGTRTKTWTVAGTYNVRARARCTTHTSVVSPWSGSLTVTITTNTSPSKPDPIETAVSNPPASGVVGGSFSVTDTVKNQGNASAGAFKVGYYLSTDKVGKTKSLTGSRSITSLAAGASSSGTVSVAVPSGTAPGTYYLLACSDSGGAVTESNETNSCRASSSTIKISGVDLIETALSNPPASGVAGGSFSVTDTVKNQGNASAGAFKVGYYLSTDKVAKTKNLTGNRSLTSLAAGATSSGTVSVTVPSGTAPGTYYLLACSDYWVAAAESNETNNCLASSSTVQIAP